MYSQTQVSLKLLVDKRGKRILQGEADKKFIDFLFTILALPVGTVIRLLTTQPLLCPISNLYSSVNALDSSYFESDQNKNDLLKPKSSVTSSQVGNLLQIESSSIKAYYRCSCNTCRTYFTATRGARCPGCRLGMFHRAEYVYGAKEERPTETGYVKENVMYMVMDHLTLKPMSFIYTISVLNAFNVDVAQIEEKVIDLDMTQVYTTILHIIHTSIPTAISFCLALLFFFYF